ncbi:hypothetical protein H4R21_006766 [Coemansia helicoidea]|uniref:Uncharacterized protein n=1 Tax=Coemansia helicoidea TaxID=1286919 RepID=A0ACC1KGF2_9FUNG|nr:hypothetical protein H4R21_006766 [Coemansia helicoidea]
MYGGVPGRSDVRADLDTEDDGRFDPFRERAKPDVQRVLFEDFRAVLREYADIAQAVLDSASTTQGMDTASA